jgi:platelet-activating factor acetylhydrolase
MHHKRAKQAGKVLPKDPNGKELDALQYPSIGEEVWMHFAPSQDELARIESESGKGLETGQCRSDTKHDALLSWA